MQWESSTPGEAETTFGDYARVIYRHKLIVVACAVLLAAAGAAYAIAKSRPYQASAQVLINQSSNAGRLNVQEAARLADTQAELANSPTIALRVVAATHDHSLTPWAFLKKSSVRTSPNADILTFTVNDASPATAIELVNEYARQFVAYSRGLGGASTTAALASLQQKITSLTKKHATRTPLYAQLVTRFQDLKNQQTLAASNLIVTRPAINATRGASHLKRDAGVGLAAGLLLGLILAFLVDSLDTSVRSEAEMGEALGVPLLARLSSPGRRSSGALVALDQRGSPAARQYTALRRQVIRLSGDGETRSLLVADAARTGYPPIVAANLAVELAYTGYGVTLVELERGWLPFADLFDLARRNGVHPRAWDAPTLVLGRLEPGAAFLEVMPATEKMEDIVDERGLSSLLAKANGQFVVACGPPLLDDADPEAFVDAFDTTIVVLPLDATKRAVLTRLATLLRQFARRPVGFVAIGGKGSGQMRQQGRGAPQPLPQHDQGAPLSAPVVGQVAAAPDTALDADWGRGH